MDEPVAPVPDPEGDKAARQRNPWKIACIGLIGVVTIGAATLLLAGNGSGQKISGSFTIMEPILEPAGERCSGEGGYSDIDEGAGVVVKDGEGKILASSQLGQGHTVDLLALYGEALAEELGISSTTNRPRRVGDISYCQFPINIDDVPKADFYTVSVGRRGELAYSYEEMTDRDWLVEFTIGG